MSEEVQNALEILPKHVLSWLIQGCIAVIFAMLIYIFNNKLDEIDRKFEVLKTEQKKLEDFATIRYDRLSDQQLIIINQINDIKLKLALVESAIQTSKSNNERGPR